MSSTLNFKQPTNLTDPNILKAGLNECKMKYEEKDGAINVFSKSGGSYQNHIATLKQNPATGKIEVECDIHYSVTSIQIADQVIELNTRTEEDQQSIINALSAVYAIGEATILCGLNGIQSNGAEVQIGGPEASNLPAMY